LTGALHDIAPVVQLSPPPPSSFASVNMANPGLPGKLPLKRRERETQGSDAL